VTPRSQRIRSLTTGETTMAKAKKLSLAECMYESIKRQKRVFPKRNKEGRYVEPPVEIVRRYKSQTFNDGLVLVFENGEKLLIRIQGINHGQ
jgi:hypothetical protein